MGVLKTKIEVDAKKGIASINAFSGALKSLGNISNDTKRGIDTLAHSLQSYAGIKDVANDLFNSFSKTADSFIKTADEMQNLNARLRLSSKSLQEFTNQQKELFKVAQNSYSPLEDVMDLYSKLNVGLREIGFNADKTTKVTEIFTKALQLGGATAMETSSAILQFSQAMGSGMLNSL